MRRRSRHVEQTRQRIVAAAVDVLAQRGAHAMTMTEVARTADVSPATVTNHFPTQDQLVEAAVAQVVSDIRVPDGTIFADAGSVPERLSALTEAMFAFFERTEHWFQLLRAELSAIPALAGAEARFWRSVSELYAEALEGTDDELLQEVTAGLVHPATYGALKATGMSARRASSVVADLLASQAEKARQ